jgi:NAD(P)H-nitrite reductase large subunit
MPVVMEGWSVDYSYQMPGVPKDAILQKDNESYAIVPSTPTGLVSPETLRKVADVAETYKALVKLTNAQRIAIVGFKRDNINTAIEELGVPLATAAGSVVRSVKACPGTATCKFGMQDALSLGLEFDKHYQGMTLPAKFKIAVSGCPNSCAESAVVDLGVIGMKKGFKVLVGGTAGARPRIGDVLTLVETKEEVLALAEKIINYYNITAKPGERMGRLIERLGIEEFKKEVMG